ncbi:MAG: hypothetical protein ACOCUS_01785 [Polyangiales bacterium]
MADSIVGADAARGARERWERVGESARDVPSIPEHVRKRLERATGASSEAVADIFSGGFSAEGLLRLLAKRMKHLNEQIGVRTRSIMNRQKDARAILDKLEALEAVQKAMNGKGEQKRRWNPDPSKKHYEKHLVHIGNESYTLKELAEQYGIEELNPRGKARVNMKEVQDLIEQYNQQLKKTNQNNELAMQELQSLMQTRSEALNLVTNMIKKFSQANDNVIRNMV